MKLNLFLCLVVAAQLFCVNAEVGADCSSTQPCSGNLEVCSGDPGKCECTVEAVSVDNTCYAYATEKENQCQFDEQCQKLKDASGPFMKKYTKCKKDTKTCVCHGEHWFLRDSKCNRGLGASCTGLDTCGIENSACSSPITGVCACKSGFRQEGEDKCVAKPECEVDSDCMDNGQCVNNKCQCKEGFVEVTQLFKKVCLPYSGPENGFSCSADEQCSLIKDESNPEGGAATCGLLSRVCGCNDGNWFPHQDGTNAKFPICVRGFGSQCSKDGQCQKGIKDGVCLDGECGCSEDYVTIEDEHQCLPYATEEKNHCEIDEQCSKFYDGSGGFLNKHPKCDNNTESCVCHEEHFAIVNDTCTRGYGAECHQLWKKCGIPHSRCGLFSNTCECKFGYVPNEDASTCDERPECTSNDDCPKNGQCVEKKCECNEGFVQTKFLFETRCMPYAAADNEFSCLANTQCSLIHDESGDQTALAKCGLLSLECECQDDTWFPTYDEKNKVGKCVRGFGSNCTSNAQCQKSIANSICEDNSCECPEDHATLEDQRLCLPYATVERNECSYDEQCGMFKENNGPLMPKHPECNQDTKACACRDEHSTLENGQCIRGLGASCGPMRPCGLEHSRCSALFKCVCESGYVQEEGSNVCTPRHECEATEDCQENADCVNNMCQCKEGFTEHDGVLKKSCLPYSTNENEFSCAYDVQCSLIVDGSGESGSSASCGVLSKKCQCKDSSWFIKEGKEGRFECVRGFGSACESTQDCTKSIKNAVCQDNTCMCPETHARIEDSNTCLPYATSKSNHCQYDEQCGLMKDSGASVFNQKPKCNVDVEACQCHQENWTLQGEQCVRGLGATCSAIKSCGVQHSVCSSSYRGTCICEDGFVQEQGSDVCTESKA